MSKLQQFTTAVKEMTGPEEGDNEHEGATPFQIDNRTIWLYPPDEGQMTILMASVGRGGGNDTDRIAGVINFFVNVLDDRGADYITERLLNRRDNFGIDEVEDIMKWMIEEWGGNPTQEPSGSTASQPDTGPRSTRTTSLLT